MALTFCSTEKILNDNPELQRQWTSLIPVGKMGRPEDLMGAVTFLCSDASTYVNVRAPLAEVEEPC
jgi:NAD(P)-dependent dehydrogenase (short-subunit alcohol dehydrogenase family)